MPQASRLNLPSSSTKQQLENKGIWNNLRSAKDADFFTLGYSGRKTHEIILTLKAHNVRTLADIRQNPVSMYRPELSKGNLTKLLAENDIAYAHIPALGVPRDIRAKAIDTGTREVIWSWYDENVITSFLSNNLHMFLNSFEHPMALMCTEIDPKECHRHRLSLALEQRGMRGFDL
jgi:uncharacterized protein (DUF488 family)